MATHLVNLDALIQRSDFEAGSDTTSQSRRLGNEVKIGELENTYLHLLKKPDFQRTTNSWGPDRVADFIKSFLDGDLIPAIIMWRSQQSGDFFVIDGAHRLSALLAWVHDDYGHGKISQEFWGYSIEPTQRKLALATKEVIEKDIGAYGLLKQVLQDHSRARDETMLLRAKNMAAFKIDLQWVEGNAKNAERSFFRINGSASIIDPTELEIIKARKKPNAIATRALMNSGMGHNYWSDFPNDTSSKIEQTAKITYDSLFKPILQAPIKTMDLPIAGQGYSENAFKMIFDLVNMVNGITPAMWESQPSSKRAKKQESPLLQDDVDGEATLKFLNAVKNAAFLVSGNYAGSLGLHPVVYFYSQSGRFQPAALLSTIKFFRELEEQDRLFYFTTHRNAFEEYLVSHRHFVSELGHAYGSRQRPLEPLVLMYRVILGEIGKGVTDHDKITSVLTKTPRLTTLEAKSGKEQRPTRRKAFSKDEKSQAFIRSAIDSPIRCSVCGARMHAQGFNFDHVTRKQDGGMGNSDNASPTHYYCNTGYKEKHNFIKNVSQFR
jgi:hypothetical protein